MADVIITAQVKDAAKWEEGFRTHGGLFTEYTATAIHFGTTDENEVAIHWAVDDVDKFLGLLDSEETKQAMVADGVNQETVKVFVLDKDLAL